MAEEKDHLQEITQEIYKRNLELAVVNKTLSLLRKLYQISLQSLETSVLAEKIAQTVRDDLNMEAVAIYLYDDKQDVLTPFGFSKSERFVSALHKSGLDLDILKIDKASTLPNFKLVVGDKSSVLLENLSDVYGSEASEGKLRIITSESHIQAIFLYPLSSDNHTIGAIMLAINRPFGSLNQHEKDSIKSFIDVVALALDKALIYEQLKVVNDQLKILDKARAEFISIASHQLRTPPATIKWYLAAMLGGDFGEISEQVRKGIESAQMTNNSLISLIDDLLNASRIERGKLEFIFEPTDVVKITKMTVDQLAPQAAQRKQTLTFHEPELPIGDVVADKEKLRQVINNFIDNAIKYTQMGGSIDAYIEKTDKDVIVKVKDNGKGIDPKDINDVFEKYNRGGTKSDSQGLGLGLYVAKVVVEQHNGKIWAESEGEGKGSTFLLSIPLKSDLKSATFDFTKKTD